jgi:ribonuclease P protein component
MQKLTKKQILRLPEEISFTLKHRSRTSQHFAYYQSSNQLDNSRIGLAIPKKNAKRAVDRNRIKRLIREAFRKNTALSQKDVVVKLVNPIGKKTKKKLRNSERKNIRQQINDHFSNE